MGETALVGADLSGGQEFVQLLDRIGVPVRGAFWFYYPDNDTWRLIIISDQAATGSKSLYVKAIQAGAKIDMTKIEFQPPTSSLYQALRRLVNVSGMSQIRLSRNIVNGIYVEDAVVYRLT